METGDERVRLLLLLTCGFADVMAWLTHFQEDGGEKQREKGMSSHSAHHLQANREWFLMITPASIKGISSI